MPTARAAHAKNSGQSADGVDGVCGLRVRGAVQKWLRAAPARSTASVGDTANSILVPRRRGKKKAEDGEQRSSQAVNPRE